MPTALIPERPALWPCSAGIRAIPLLDKMLDADILPSRPGSFGRPGAGADVIVGWGARASGRRAEQLAARRGVACWRLEDGFIRSFGIGDRFPALSVTVDPVGVYYDASRPSLLENLLNSDDPLLDGIETDVRRARQLILDKHLSKYNLAPPRENVPAREQRMTVLVVDQTVGDRSIALAQADASSFRHMLTVARHENPSARIIVKTHPETVSGRKHGHLTSIESDADTLVLHDLVNPISLLEQVDSVYTVSSQLGFEALLAGKTVHCFGLPWYAGWGQTRDRVFCTRRKKQRSIDELFAAAYFHLSRYLNPRTHKAGTIFDVIDFVVRQRDLATKEPKHTWCIGFRRWKAVNIRPLLGLNQQGISFIESVDKLPAGKPAPGDRIIVWGCGDGGQHKLCRMEDGFVRSIGLGSDLIRPVSLVIDDEGIYFDPSTPSKLERILSNTHFSEAELAQAVRVRELLTTNELTKYNTDNTRVPDWPASGQRKRILVPGQVADDASVKLGGAGIHGNPGLLEAVRQRHPEAFIVYRPHPDVLSRNRQGALAAREVLRWADYIETDTGILGCIEACHEVHTLSSLAGFDALMRGTPVTTYGQPFYAGWGLTTDIAPVARRQHRLSIDELVAGTLLRYPVYWDWTLNSYTDCEAAIHHLIDERNALLSINNGTLPRIGYLRRQARKLKILGQAWTAQ